MSTTAFKQVKNGAKTLVAANALNNTTSPLTFSVQTGTGTKFPSPGNGFYVTAYNSGTYGDPNDDPNMRIGLCTARSTDSFTVTWGQLGTSITAMSGTPDLRLIMVDQLLVDLNTAVNALETTTGQSGSTANLASPAITGTVTGAASYTSPTLTGTVGGTATFGGITINSPTIVTPTIASFANANHDHSNSAGGGSLGTNVVTAPMLTTSAITLGYAQITGTVTLTTPASPALVTGLSATVTIPAGGRKVKITTCGYSVNSTNANATVTISIWDGTVGSGTQLAAWANSSGTVGSDSHGFTCIAVVTPGAGSKTYNIGSSSTAGNSVITASATAPAFILVEAI